MSTAASATPVPFDFPKELARCGGDAQFFNTYLSPVILEMAQAAGGDWEATKQALALAIRMSWVAQVKTQDLQGEEQDRAQEWMKAATILFLMEEQNKPDTTPPKPRHDRFRFWSTAEKREIAVKLRAFGVDQESIPFLLTGFARDPQLEWRRLWGEDSVLVSTEPTLEGRPFSYPSPLITPSSWKTAFFQWKQAPATLDLLSTLGEPALGVLNRLLSPDGAPSWEHPLGECAQTQSRLVSELLALAQSFETWMSEAHPAPANKKIPPFPKNLSAWEPPVWAARDELRAGIARQLQVDFAQALGECATQDRPPLEAVLQGQPPTVEAQAAELAFLTWIDLQDNVQAVEKERWEQDLREWGTQSSVWTAPLNVQKAMQNNGFPLDVQGADWERVGAEALVGGLELVAFNVLGAQSASTPLPLPGSMVLQLARSAQPVQQQASAALEALRTNSGAFVIEWAQGQEAQVEERLQWMTPSATRQWMQSQVKTVRLSDRAQVFRVNEALIDVAMGAEMEDVASAWQQAMAPAFARWERDSLMESTNSVDIDVLSPAEKPAMGREIKTRNRRL